MKKTTAAPKKTGVPQFLFDAQGNKVGVLLPRTHYEKLMDTVDDYHDYQMSTKLLKKKLTRK